MALREGPSSDVGDVAGGLIAELETGAELVDVGTFKLDIVKAREKLAAYQLADPDRFVLLLVEAGHLLRGCSGIEFELDDGRVRARFVGVELSAAQLRGCFDALFVEVQGLEASEARELRGRQRLAMAINTALDLAEDGVELSSRGAEGRVRVVFGRRGEVESEVQPSRGEPMLAFEFEDRASSLLRPGGRAPALRKLLREDARYASLPLTLDGERIDAGLTYPEFVGEVDLRDPDGQVLGRAGWCAARARDAAGAMVFVANGVAVETLVNPRLPPGFVALVDADGLERDLSQTKLQRGDAFARRVEAVEASYPALPVPVLGPDDDDERQVMFGFVSWIPLGVLLLAAGVVMAIIEADELLFMLVFVVTGLGALYVGISRMVHGARMRRVRLRGRPSLARVEEVEPTGTKLNRIPQLRFTLDVEGTRVSVSRVVDAQDRRRLEAGARVYVRVDPDDPTFVVLDAGR